MKHQYKILQLTLFITLFTGCDAKTYVVSDEPKPEGIKRNEIGFNVVNQNTKTDNAKTITRNGFTVEVKDLLNNKKTKGTIITSSTIADFGVFGYSTNSNAWSTDATPNMFHDLKVLESNNWNSKKYWVEGKNSFFAYAPYKTETNGITITSTEATAGAPIIKYVMATDVAKQPDVLVATPALNKTKPTEGTNTGVPMTFKHKLAAIGFRAIEAYGGSISSISITGIKTEGTLKIDNGAETEWDTSKQTDVSNLNYPAGVDPTAVGGYDCNIAEVDLMKADGYLMVIPQTFNNDAKITVKFTGGEATQRVINLNDYIITAEAGKKYTCALSLLIPPPPQYANCYIAKPGDIIMFNAKLIGILPNDIPYDTYNPKLTGQSNYGTQSGNNITIDTKSVALKWQTAHGRITGASADKMLIPADGIAYYPATGECTVEINESTATIPGGSAYLCAYDNTDPKAVGAKILWSWHIWVVKDDIATFDANGFQMQDRALGAISKTAGVNSFGMMYQWGRKDPFTPATTTGNETNKDTQLYNASGTHTRLVELRD